MRGIVLSDGTAARHLDALKLLEQVRWRLRLAQEEVRACGIRVWLILCPGTQGDTARGVKDATELREYLAGELPRQIPVDQNDLGLKREDAVHQIRLGAKGPEYLNVWLLIEQARERPL